MTLFSTLGSAMGNILRVARSMTFTTYCRRPTVSSAQAMSLLFGADGDVADLEEVVALRQLVAVQQDFLGRIRSVPARRE